MSDVDTICAPTTRYEELPFNALPGDWEAAIFTSERSVAIIEKRGLHKTLLQAISCFTFGQKTHDKLIAVGLKATRIPADSGREMAAKLPDNLSYIYFCPQKPAHDIKQLLAKRGVNCTEAPLYRTIICPPPEDVIQAIKTKTGIGVVCFGSPLAVAGYCESDAPRNLPAVCIGRTTEREARNAFQTTAIAAEPTLESLIDTAKKVLADNN